HAQRLPGPRASLWSDVQAAIAAAERRRLRPLLPRRLPHRAARPVWTGLGAMAATLTVTVLFGLVLRGMLAGHTGTTIRVPRTATAEQTETQSATPTALATQSPYLSPVPGTPPSWHSDTLPQGIQLDQHVTALTVAPSNGNTAYICGDVPIDSPFPEKVLVTYDRGTHWTNVSSVPAYAPCNLIVDETNPDIVVV